MENNKSYNAVNIGNCKKPKTSYKVYYNRNINSKSKNTNKYTINGE